MRFPTSLSVCFGLLLSAGVVVASSYAPRVEFGARLEPGNRIIHGAGQDPVGFASYRSAFDETHQPLITMTYIGLIHPVAGIVAWGEGLRAELANMAPLQVIPQIGLNLTQGQDDGSGREDAVAAGDYDEQLGAFASAVLAVKRPVFIRIGYEFDGSWNNYRPASFVRAWRHIVRFLFTRGVPFATVWCAAGASSGWPSLERLLEFYPGDEWVDWWGVDIFSEDEFTRPELSAFLDAARNRRKPVMIGEMTPRFVGVLEGESSWERWFGPMIDLLQRRSEIKATAYINWAWREWSDRLGYSWHDWGDARLSSNAVVRERWVRAMADPIYLHAAPDGSLLLPPLTN